MIFREFRGNPKKVGIDYDNYIERNNTNDDI